MTGSGTFPGNDQENNSYYYFQYVYGSSPSSNHNSCSAIAGRPYSLYTWSHIWCNGELDITSDARIKNVLDTSVNASDLAAIKKLKVVDYQYIDKIGKGDGKIKGFLAQQVETVFPDAVSKQPGTIPNIYKPSDAVSYDAASKKLTVTISGEHGLVIGDKVQLITQKDGKDNPVDAIVCGVPNEHTFVVESWDSNTPHVFVYGKEVPDLRNIDYNKIFSAGISAIQQLSKQLDQANAKIEDLTHRNQALEIKTNTLASAKCDASEINDLKLQLQELKALMEKNGIRSEK